MIIVKIRDKANIGENQSTKRVIRKFRVKNIKKIGYYKNLAKNINFKSHNEFIDIKEI